MEPAGFVRSPGQPDPSLTPRRLEDELDFFHKLGYSTPQVKAVRRKYGPNTDRNQILGELVRMRADLGLGQERQPVTTLSVPVTKNAIRAVEPTGMLPLASQSEKEGSDDDDTLRPIVIDGSNVAMSHGNKEVFSCMGIQLAVDFFLDRGHTSITVFVPSWRKEQPRPDVPISDQKILADLEKKKRLTFTPSRRVGHKRVVCNDDKFIVQLAFDTGGVIVSNDVYRDLQVDKPEWKSCIEERLLMYSFVNDKFMVPDDPLGRDGPNLENFLRWSPKTPKKLTCPYGKKCTYGLRCKYLHPGRAKQSNCLLADELRENAKLSHTAPRSSVRSPASCQSLSLVEDAAMKLTLLEKSSLKKEKVNHCSRQKPSCKKGWSSLGSSEHGSHKHLDSGIGSIESQSMEAQQANGHTRYGATSGNFHPMPTSQPWSAPSRCCLHDSASWQTLQDQHLHHSTRPDVLPVDSPPPHTSYGEERKVTHTKLLAIFSADLVDAAMDMFPLVVDPQMLAAKIVMMQSHNKMR
ncbi:endoribonuclease ZC3H12A [Vanacampus margaritifer]